MTPGSARLLEVVTRLALPERRRDGTAALARLFGADGLIVFVRDGEVDALLPAPGFPQTLPDGTRWETFLADCARAGSLARALQSPYHGGAKVPALGRAAADGSVIVFLGGTPLVDTGELQALLPLLAIALQNERAALAAEGRTVVERESGRQFEALASAFDGVRRELQRALVDVARAGAELEAAIHSRDRILAIVSHDARGPLATIQLSASVLAMTAPPETAGDDTRSRADAIVRSVGRIERLVQDLLDFGSIEAGRLAVRIERHEPVKMLREALATFAPLALEKGVRLEGEVVGEAPAAACDRDRVFQVLSNLVGNAISATPAGGSVRLRLEGREREVLFAVADTGRGIRADEMPRLFESYWRSRDAHYRGTGLGLSIAKGIVDAHRGRIWAESVVGAGSTFSFALPIEAESAGERSPLLAPASDRS